MTLATLGLLTMVYWIQRFTTSWGDMSMRSGMGRMRDEASQFSVCGPRMGPISTARTRTSFLKKLSCSPACIPGCCFPPKLAPSFSYWKFFFSYRIGKQSFKKRECLSLPKQLSPPNPTLKQRSSQSI